MAFDATHSASINTESINADASTTEEEIDKRGNVRLKAIKIFLIGVEQTILDSNKSLQFSEALGYDISDDMKKIVSEPKQFCNLLTEWLNVIIKTGRNPIPYLERALNIVDEHDLVEKLKEKFNSSNMKYCITSDDIERLKQQLTSWNCSTTDTLSSNVVDEPSSSIGICLTVDGRQVVRSVEVTFEIEVKIDEQLKHDYVIWRWKRNVEDVYTKCLSNSTQYEIGNVENPSLTIKHVQKSDEGYYVCQILNAKGSINSKEISLEICKVLLGNSSNLKCSVNSKDPIVSTDWYKDGQDNSPKSVLFSGGTVEEPSLTFVNCKEYHEGKPRREVSNEAETVSTEKAFSKRGVQGKASSRLNTRRMSEISYVEGSESRTGTTGAWFYKLVICCDGRMVNVDSCQSTSICRNNVKLFYNVKSRGQSELSSHLHSLLRKDKKDLEILFTLSTLLQSNLILPEDWLLTAIAHQHQMACYMLLAYMTGTDKKKESVIIPALNMAIEKGDRDITNMISWFIIKELLKSLSFRIDGLLDIWPAIVCKNINCHKSVFCSKELVIVVETFQSVNNLPIQFWNLKIKLLIQSDDTKIGEKVMSKDCMNTNISVSIEGCFPEKFEIDGHLASELFKMHSKLTFICKSTCKLKEGAKVNLPCVQLFCRRKGLIPVKESHFPKSIYNVKTDILEGEPVLGNILRTGDQIKSEYSIGTLGGFVKILGDTTFLTCAHVVVHKDIICSKKMSIPNNKAIEIECEQTSPKSQTNFICGRVRNYEFKTDREGETSIDAALITLKEGIDINNGDFIANRFGNKHTYELLGIKSPFLNENCLDYEKIFYGKHFSQFNNVTIGAKSGITVNESNIKVIKDREDGVHIDLETYMDTYNKITQSETQNTAHSSIFSSTAPMFTNHAHTQETRLLKVDHERTYRRLSRCMYNQIAVTHIPFKPGDSGTCVYVCDNSLKAYGCMGMAIANHPGPDCGAILTPMKEILKTFHVDVQ